MQIQIVGFVVYFFIVAMIALASYLHNRTSASNNYGQVILGNRSINYFLTALSAHASDMSDWLFMAFPGLLYTGGLINAWVAIGLVGGMWFTWQFIAPQLRRKTEEFDCYTLSTFFERRFQDSSGMLRLISALISIFFFAVYIAAGLKGFGMLTESLFQLPYVIGTLIAMFFVIIYIVLGGYRALAWIDCFQALFLLFMILIVPLVAFGYIGGWQAIVQSAGARNIPLTLFPDTVVGTINALLLAFGWGVGYLGMPHLLTKFMGISDVKEITKAKYIGLSWQITVFTAAGLVGLIGIAYFPQVLANSEYVFIEIVKDLFSQLFAGFILSAVAGAILSVATAQMLVLVSVITEDFYRNWVRPKATEQELLWVYRVSIVVIALFSFCISLDKTSSINALVSYAWMGFASSFAPLVLLSLHSKIINKYGAYACLIIGGSIAALWPLLNRPLYGITVPTAVAGFALSIVGAYVVSCMTKKCS